MPKKTKFTFVAKYHNSYHEKMKLKLASITLNTMKTS
jgi:hypothetical protein